MSAPSGDDRAQRGRGGGRPTRDEAAAEITRLLEPAVTAAGFDLEEVDVRPAGRRRLVRVVVDADGGVALDDVAELSRTASEALDASGVMGTSPYVLEVTSPGVDRPLTEPRHWRRATGRLVVAPLTDGGQVEGRVVSADDASVVLDVVPARKGAAPKRRAFDYAALGRGRVQVEFRRTDEPDEADEPADEAAATRSPAEPD
ncbi:ribosome maturation factor RimP [Actinomadura rayongensis]|uniref:Ribosome maturation factor RimP n=1 Tax=Actinomadura rayongensis TaxID=1429076 RepID=A0A6I4VZ16_9ACTN|nr:ribosome maturation factor RimP [Actinomadura rayongensis]MXQ63599.1 ribosome maturation factor RimP [Actinomadura rayongensis]